MKKIKLVITAIILLLTLGNTLHAQNNKLQALNWLTGTWVMTMKAGTAYESWRYINDSTYAGKSYLVKANGDTIPQEDVSLVYRNGQMFYIPTAYGQNNNQPVPFTITSLKTNEFVAENPAHDFPQKITYTLKSPGNLYASIEGNYKGKFVKEGYDMKKKQGG